MSQPLPLMVNPPPPALRPVALPALPPVRFMASPWQKTASSRKRFWFFVNQCARPSVIQTGMDSGWIECARQHEKKRCARLWRISTWSSWSPPYLSSEAWKPLMQKP